MLPAGVIREVDLTDEVIYVDRTKDEIKDSRSSMRAPTAMSYRSDLGDYYASRRM